MPLPWRPGAGPAFIPDVAARGITIQQLFDLRDYLSSLCKTCLLRNTSEFSKHLGTHGQLIEWSSINMYQITDEVIKKAIPFVDPLKDRFPDRQWYSWVEFVAKRPQPAKIMLSHSWSGRFMDFMHSIDLLFECKSLSVNTSIWICTFANCQFGEDFGVALIQCPFLKALKTVQLTVLVVDRRAASLTRSWCGLELHETIATGKDLELYTSVGRVGSVKASSGPLIDAIQRWDIRRTEATEASYRRQIFNYIAGTTEVQGLKCDAEDKTKPVLVEGRPQLLGVDVEDDYPRRLTGDKEFQYEARLFKTHGEAFEDLNMNVRLEVMAKIGRARPPQGCKANVAERGVTLGRLRAFARRMQRECQTWKAPLRWESVSVKDLIERVVGPATELERCSYMEMVSDCPVPPKYFVNYSNSVPFHEIMSSIEWFAEAMQLSDSTPLWVFFLSLSSDEASADEQNKPLVEHSFAEAMHQCEGLVCCFSEDEKTLGYAWRWIEVELAVRFGKSLYVACPQGVLACVKSFPHGGRLFGEFSSVIARALTKVRMEEVSAPNRRDHDTIIEFFEDGLSSDRERQRRYDRFNARLRRVTAGVLVCSAALTCDLDELRAVCGIPGLALNSDTMRGGFCESAAHLAAASGPHCIEALRLLLDLRMDPDGSDLVEERPLHYAAMTGNAEAARLLLAFRADPLCESIFGETPLSLAEQNPAEFLKVSTAEVATVLRAAEDSCPAVGSGLNAIRAAQRPCCEQL